MILLNWITMSNKGKKEASFLYSSRDSLNHTYNNTYLLYHIIDLAVQSSPEPFCCDSPNNCPKDMITYDIDGYLKNDGLSMPLVCPIFLFYLCNHQRTLSVIHALF